MNSAATFAPGGRRVSGQGRCSASSTAVQLTDGVPGQLGPNQPQDRNQQLVVVLPPSELHPPEPCKQDTVLCWLRLEKGGCGLPW